VVIELTATVLRAVQNMIAARKRHVLLFIFIFV
jgi:hypothetical protein